MRARGVFVLLRTEKDLTHVSEYKQEAMWLYSGPVN